MRRTVAVVFSSTTLLFLGGALAAGAADMPVKAKPLPYVQASNWTGFYAGINAGYGWNTSRTDEIALDPTLVIPAQGAGSLPTSLRPRVDGFVGGGQIGYNWQRGQYVAGLETDFDYSGMRGTATDAVGPIPPFPGLTTTQTNKLAWFGTARVRAGWLVTPSTLIYGTAGLAYGEAKASTNVVVTTGASCPIGSAFCAVGSVSDTRLGWTAGGGLESMLGANWTVKVEYLYYNLGSVTEPIIATTTFPPLGGTETMQAKARFDGNIVRACLNYKFN